MRSKSDQPKVSVVIPVYNREKSISPSIESVLSQTYDNKEIIIVDDGSYDSSVEVVKNYSNQDITLIEHEENRGGSEARNTGIENADGEYIAFLDSDDRWEPQKLQVQVSLLENRDSSWIATYCNVRHTSGNLISEAIKNTGNYNGKKEGGAELIPDILSLRFKLGGASTLVVRSSIVNKIDGFDPEFERHQDFEFVIRLLKQGKLAHSPNPLVIKQSSGYPSAKAVENAKEQLFDKFKQEIHEAESQGIPVKKHQRFDLARCHMANGDWRKSIMLLQESQPYNRGILGYLKAVLDRTLP